MKENETLQDRLSDMRVTLQENKAMMEEFMTAQMQSAAPPATQKDENAKQKDEEVKATAGEPSGADDAN